MTNDQARQFVSALFREVFDRYDRKKVAKFFSEDLTGFILTQPINRDGIIAWLDRLEAAYSQCESMVHQVVLEGRQIAAVVNLSLTDRTNQEKLYVSLALFLELGNRGKIIKFRNFTSN